MSARPPDMIIGPHRLYLGDAYEIIPAIAPAFAPASTVCVMDPQYEMDMAGGGAFRKARKYADAIEAHGLNEGFDPAILDVASAEGEASRWCDSAFVFCHDNQGPDLWAALRARYQNAQICGWRKDNPPPVFNKNYLPDLELYFHAWNRNAAPVGDYRSLSRIKDGPIVKTDYGHPTVKPQHIMCAIMANAAPGLIVDPFMGTGSTGLAAIADDRVFVGIEKDPRWFKVAAKRISDAVKWRTPADDLKAPGPDEAPLSEETAPMFDEDAA